MWLFACVLLTSCHYLLAAALVRNKRTHLTLKIPNYFIVISIGLCERYRCPQEENTTANCDLCKNTYTNTHRPDDRTVATKSPRWCTCSSHHLPIYTKFNWFFLSYTRFQIEMRCNLIRFCSLSARGFCFVCRLGSVSCVCLFSIVYLFG